MAMLPKFIYIFNALPVKIPTSPFPEMNNTKIHMELLCTQNSQSSFEKQI